MSCTCRLDCINTHKASSRTVFTTSVYMINNIVILVKGYSVLNIPTQFVCSKHVASEKS